MSLALISLLLNPCPPDPFSVTHPPKGGGGSYCNPLPGFLSRLNLVQEET